MSAPLLPYIPKFRSAALQRGGPLAPDPPADDGRRTWHDAHVEKLSTGDRIADRVASFIGSWAFIIGQSVIMAVWMLVNSLELFGAMRFDEFPFVFLNLFMSAEAAFATPLILMSQNRSAERDRENAEHDYAVNVAAKAEIEELMTTLARIENEKLDLIIKGLPVTNSIVDSAHGV